MTRPSWYARALVALAPHPPGYAFSAGGLKHVIIEHERPDIQALWERQQAAKKAGVRLTGDEEFAWLHAVQAWEKDNPGHSAGNLRRVCERLTDEGALKKTQRLRGWYVQNIYSKPEATPSDTPAGGGAVIFHVYPTITGGYNQTPDAPPCEGAQWIPAPLPRVPDAGFWVIELHTAAEVLAFAQASEGGEVIISGDMPTQLAGRCDGTLEIYNTYRE